MFFFLSKILWWVIDPGNIVFFTLLIGVLLSWGRWQKWGRRLCFLALLVLFVFGVLPTGNYLVAQLENRFQYRNEGAQHIDGIIVLGGIIDAEVSKTREKLAFRPSVSRVLALSELSAKHPDAKVVFTSGAGVLGRPDLVEGDMLAAFVSKQLTRPENLIVENKARNTYENVVLSKALVKPEAGERWLLVTSALHMPRSVGIFRRQGWEVIPYPANYVTSAEMDLFDLQYPRIGLTNFKRALHEWLGLFVYYLTDKTNSLFPAP